MSKKKAVEIIVKHKANKMIKGSEQYENHIKTVLKLRHIKASKEAVEAFKMGAVDAMIYDVAPTLGFRPSYKKRLEMLKEIFSNSI
ncbi:MAG: hypothetical protein IIC00_15000 [Planctomycetes bacterium]|nr:hypothetical protein [Planctomycetota bacterium]